MSHLKHLALLSIVVSCGSEPEACIWSRDDGGSLDRQMCTEAPDAECTDLDVADGENTVGPLSASPEGDCPNDEPPSNPDSSCSDASGYLWVFYDNAGEAGWDVYCERCAADLTPADFCD